MAKEAWTLEELGAQVREALAVGYVPPGSARVRAIPDARTIRYYTTIGLVDRPELDGRTAIYGRRHLLQLVAIKRLQAEGMSLDEVQACLAGVPTKRLAEVAMLWQAEREALPSPASESTPESTPEPMSESGPGSRRGSFWKTLPPAPVELPAAEPARGDDEGASARLEGVLLAPGVRLVLDAPRRLDDEDLREIRRAADALLAMIETRGLRPGTRRGEA